MSDVDNMSCLVIDDCSSQNSVDRESCSSTDKRYFEIEEVVENERESSVSGDCTEVDLSPILNMHLEMLEKHCRICSVSIDMTNDNTECDDFTLIELGCSCKNDLATAHKHCAEHWFWIKGDKICEICGSIARNVASAIEIELAELWNEGDNGIPMTSTALPVEESPSLLVEESPSLPAEESEVALPGYRFFNILLACLICSAVFGWILHSHTPK